MAAALFFAFCLFILGIGFAVVYVTVRHHWFDQLKIGKRKAQKAEQTSGVSGH